MTCLKTSCTIRAGWGMVIVSIFLKEEGKKERKRHRKVNNGCSAHNLLDPLGI